MVENESGKNLPSQSSSSEVLKIPATVRSDLQQILKNAYDPNRVIVTEKDKSLVEDGNNRGEGSAGDIEKSRIQTLSEYGIPELPPWNPKKIEPELPRKKVKGIRRDRKNPKK